MRILVVEDNIALADGISRAISKAGFAVDVTGDGTEASEILATQDYDLVVLDLNLPGCDGLEILKNLRRRARDSQVLVLTARDRDRKSTRLNSSHIPLSRMPSSA